MEVSKMLQRPQNIYLHRTQCTTLNQFKSSPKTIRFMFFQPISTKYAQTRKKHSIWINKDKKTEHLTPSTYEQFIMHTMRSNSMWTSWKLIKTLKDSLKKCKKVLCNAKHNRMNFLMCVYVPVPRICNLHRTKL